MIQMCEMEFQVQGKTDDYVRLEKDFDGVEFLGSRLKLHFSYKHHNYRRNYLLGGRQLVEYEIQLEALHIETVNRISRAVVKIVFRRNMQFHVANTFLQTFLLVAVGALTLFFAIDNFTDRIMVTLTTLLVIATVTASIQAVRTLPIFIAMHTSTPQQGILGRT